jgi:hypothetical protein
MCGVAPFNNDLSPDMTDLEGGNLLIITGSQLNLYEIWILF